MSDSPRTWTIRVALALVWLYQGFWCKLLGRMPHHQEVIGAPPFLGGELGHAALIVLGVVECGIAVWVLSGHWARLAAMAQTALLLAMNAGGVIWASRIIPDPVGMLFQNFAFLVLAWIAAEEVHHVAHA